MNTETMPPKGEPVNDIGAGGTERPNVPDISALVSWRLLNETWAAWMSSYVTRNAAQHGEKDGRDTRTAPALLGLQIDTLLRVQARHGRSTAMTCPEKLVQMLRRGSDEVYAAISWLRSQGIERTEGVWRLELPSSSGGCYFVPVPASSVVVLDAKDFLVLARLHELAELSDASEERHNLAIPRRHYFSGESALSLARKVRGLEGNVAFKEGGRCRSVVKAFERLQKASFFDMDALLLTPKEAHDRHLGERSLLDLMGEARDAKDYRLLRGGDVNLARGQAKPRPIRPTYPWPRSVGTIAPKS